MYCFCFGLGENFENVPSNGVFVNYVSSSELFTGYQCTVIEFSKLVRYNSQINDKLARYMQKNWVPSKILRRISCKISLTCRSFIDLKVLARDVLARKKRRGNAYPK